MASICHAQPARAGATAVHASDAADLLPVAAALVPAGDDASEPLDAACARHARHNHPQGKAVVHREGSALHLLLRASCVFRTHAAG